MRYVLEIAYKGTYYHGWQKQKNAPSVQETLENKLEILLKRPVETTGAGRTDTGVHALKQMVSFDGMLPCAPELFLFKLQQLLPWDIAVKALYLTNDAFSVRHDAISRSYIYRIHQIKDPFLTGLSTFLPRKNLNVSAMNHAAQLLLEHTDYASFCKYHTANSHFECHIYKASWEKTDEGYNFYITANRFLRGMVRALVGAFIQIGTGELNENTFKTILEAKDRRAAGRSMPPEGLYLSDVRYEQNVLKRLACF